MEKAENPKKSRQNKNLIKKMKKITFFFCALMLCLSARANYYVVGDFNGWDVSNAIELTTTDGTNYTVQLDTLRGGFKIISARDWNHTVYGAYYSGNLLSVGQTINLEDESYTSRYNINVAGCYVNALLSLNTIYSDPVLTLVSGIGTYYIVGDFNNWNVATAVEMTTTDGVHYYVHLDTLYGGFKITSTRDWDHLNWGARDSINSFSYIYNGYDRYFGEMKTNENWEEDPNYNILTDQGYSNVTLGLYIWNDYYDDIYKCSLWYDTVTCAGIKFYDNNFRYQITSVSPAEVSIIGNRISSPTDLIIPSSVNYNGTDFAVTAIGNDAFYGCTNLTSVVLPNSLTYIGEYAFGGTGLSSIILPNSLTYIGESAFRSTGLSSVIIPENVDTIGKGAFFCDNLSLVIWNARNGHTTSTIDYSYYENYDYHPYALCVFWPSVQTFIFGDHVQTIPDNICSGLTQLTSIALPNTVTKIGKSAFRYCSGLISFTMENGVQTIGNDAFSYCSNLPQIVLPNTVTKIGESAFYNCRNLTTATVGNSVDTIGFYAFMYCERLISIELPATVTFLADRAFAGCSAMTKAIVHSTAQLSSDGCLIANPQIDTIVAPSSIFDVNEGSWPNCTKKIKYIRVNSGELTENGLAVIRRSASTLETLDVAATTNTTMADEAFSNMYNLTTLALPQNLERISYMAVAGCKMLPSISIPATVTEIGTSAFEHCRSLQAVIFSGNNLQTIGNWAFYNNHALRQITIPAGVTTVGDGAFYGCNYLEELAMPASLRNVGDNAFALCNHLTKMQVEATLPPQVAARTFFDVNRAIPVYVPDEAVNDYRNTAIWQEFFIRPISQAATGIETVRESDSDSQDEMLPDGKFMQNGQLLIRKNGRIYDAQGRLVE